MDRVKSEIIIVNGLVLPAPDMGFEITNSIMVDGGRNANGVTVGHIVGPPEGLYKLNNLTWKNLSPEQWAQIRNALKPFYVPVTFTNDLNQRITITMYPGDKNCKPFHVENLSYQRFKECKFNLIDTGKR